LGLIPAYKLPEIVMATIEKRSDSNGSLTYRVKVRMRGYPQATASFKQRTHAKHWAAQTESAMREGRYFNCPESRKHTLADAIDRYKKEVLKNLTDLSHRICHLDWWRKEIGMSLLADIHPATISQYKTKLGNTPSDFGRHKNKLRSDSTVNRYLASLSALLNTATKEWNWLESNPCEKVKRNKEPRGRVRFLSDSERKSLIAACDVEKDMPELKLIVLISMTTGARRGEIMNLRWRHVDLKSSRITLVDTKNGDTRSIPIVDPVTGLLSQWSKVRSIDDNSYVFPGHTESTKGKPLDFDKTWRNVLVFSGVSDFRFHDLRHTAASYLAMNGAGIREIGDILGHKSLSMVQRYSHLCDDHKKATVERMTKAVFGEAQ
jgi:integrase